MENKSSFQFKGYIVKKSLIEIKDSRSNDLTVEFEPSGINNKIKTSFTLSLLVKVFDAENNINIEVEFEGEYQYSQNEDNLSSFMLVNAPALLFPYIRSYITALTALSGVPPITLPTLNLTGLSEQLAKNITNI